MRAGEDGRGGYALHPLHLRHDREAEGHHAHDRRLSDVGTYATTKWVFDLKEDDVYWCTADIGWVTGHSYVVYGPLANGATVVMYEGAPDWPQKDRFWQIIERYGVTIFYTAPTAIRAFMRWGTEWPKKRDLSSLRLLGSVGEPINPEAWVWYHRYIGGEKMSGRRHMVADRDRRHHDHAATWLDDDEARLGDTRLSWCQGGDQERERRHHADGGGLLSLTRPWPSMLRGIYGDPERYVSCTGANGRRTSISRATARSSMPTASSGCSAAWTMC